MADPNDHKQKQRRDKSEYWQRKHYKIQRLISIGGLLGLIVLSLQWCEMHKATIQAITATKAATEANRMARETSHLDQRAWVAPSQIVGKPEEGKPYEMTVTIKNTGKTFARECYAQTGFTKRGIGDPPPDFDAELAKMSKEFARELTGTTSLLAPNGTFLSIVKVGRGRNLTKDDMLELTAPTALIFVFGKITYKDIFNCDHWTRFSTQCFADGTIVNFGQYTQDDDNQCP